jgi:hypothetical protein
MALARHAPCLAHKEKQNFEIFFLKKPHDPKLCGDVMWLSS